jgi:tetratricopeptide (TPR) repeat protein
MKVSFKTVQHPFIAGMARMRRGGSPWVVGLVVACTLFAGCHTDPNVRKHKYLESGNRYSAEGKYKESVIQYANALKIDKNYADAHYSLAQAYLHLGQIGPGYGELKRTVDLQPSNFKARLDLGKLLLAGGQTDKAQEQADAVKAAQPDNPDLHALLSGIAAKKGLKSDALAEIQRAVELDPKRAEFHEDLAIVEAGDPGKVSDVEDELKKSIALNPKSVNPRLLLTAFYVGHSRWTEAEQAASGAVSADPKSLSARETLAQVFLRQGNQAKGEEVLRQAESDLSDDPQGVSILAEYYERSGQSDKARAEFASLAAKYPKNVAVQEGYVRALLQVRDYGIAQTVIDGLMKKNGRDPQVVALHGIVLLNAGKVDDAMYALQNAEKDYPDDSYIQFWLGKAALAKGDLQTAKASFSQVAAHNPSRLDAQQELARIAVQTGDMELLSDVAGKTIAATPKFSGAYVWRATVEMTQNSLDKAESDLKTAMGLAPQSAPAYLLMGKLRFAQKKLPEGAALLEQALQYDPDSAEAMRLLISYDLYQKNPEKAYARLNAQIARNPKNSTYLVFLTELQIQDNNFDQAAATAQRAIQINPGDAEAVMLFAKVQVKRGQIDNAVSAWEQWSNAHPKDAGSVAILGTLEESRGNQAKAEAYYKKSLEIQPQQPLASNNLAYLMLQNGENIDVALALAQTARRAMPNSPNTADTLAWAYYQKGAFGFARDLLEDAVKTDGNNATMQYHLGMVYGKLQDRSKATIHLKKALLLAPNSPAAKDASTALQGLG